MQSTFLYIKTKDDVEPAILYSKIFEEAKSQMLLKTSKVNKVIKKKEKKIIHSYKDKHTPEIENIVSSEFNQICNKHKHKQYLKIKEIKRTPLFLKEIEPIMFISKKNPLLEINQKGTIQQMFKDEMLMRKLLYDNMNKVNEKLLIK